MLDFQWLDQAKSLEVGQSKRIYHGAEHRPNLVVRNLPDKYTAYCFACKEYAEKRKDFVRILEEQATATNQITGETDVFMNLLEPSAKWLTPFSDVAYFLHTKHMCLEWLRPYEPKWDSKRNRLVIDFQGKRVGRDIYGCSNIKWYNYRAVEYQDSFVYHNIIILCQDVLSAAKGIKATGLPFYALFGTALNRGLESRITASNVKRVGIMLDGDDAGRKGASRIRQRLSLLGIQGIILNPQKGDPKEQTLDWYRQRCKI